VAVEEEEFVGVHALRMVAAGGEGTLPAVGICGAIFIVAAVVEAVSDRNTSAINKHVLRLIKAINP